ncbi:MAG: tyrosine-type recombinase/integrase [Flavobacteriales bacterium]|jgi:integrase|nr:tyrosine-type recombinase/integrase [Flavobacteriales bacterium]
MIKNRKVRPILSRAHKKKNGMIPIYIEVTNSRGLRKRKSSGMEVNEKHWYGEYPNYISSKDLEADQKNEQLKKIVDEIASIDGAFGKKMDFKEYYPVFIEENDPRVGEKRQLEYRRTLSHLLLFEKQNSYPITYEAFDNHFANRFSAFLKSLGYGTNYRLKFFKVIKQVLNQAHGRNLHDNRIPQTSPNWRFPEEKPDMIYLKEDDLDRIAILSLDDNLRVIRDFVIMMAYTGLRFEDFMTLTKDNLEEHRGKLQIRKVQSKTKNLVVIPIKPIVKDLIDKYDGFPPRVSNQYFNRRIKTVCQLAGVKEWEKVTAHTLRRTFATNGYLAQIPTIELMKITGHQTESEFLRYIRIGKQEAADKMSEHPFFN